MKKALYTLIILISGGILTVGFLIFYRYQQNPEQIFPYPYQFQNKSAPVDIQAPIVITGDRMGVQFAKFKGQLANSISINLDKPIKIQSLATEGWALHRTLHELRSLDQWPQILIYQGSSEEFKELKFNLEDVKIIKKNFSLYQDDRIETLLILFPWLSRIVYWPHERVIFTEDLTPAHDLTEGDYLSRLETELLLFEQQLIQLINMSKDRNSLLILTTTPVNLDISPKKVCSFTSTPEVEEKIVEINNLLENNNPKAAYTLSSKLIQQYLGHAKLLFTHGQVARRLGRRDEAIKFLLQSSAYDCQPWRSSELYNSIMRRVAANQQVILFDFARLVEGQWNKNISFADEIYAQNLFYEMAMNRLGPVIKQILKL